MFLLSHSWFIYPNELEVKDTTDTQTSASYLDLHLKVDDGSKLKTKICDKRDDSSFPIANFPSSVLIFQHHQRMEFTFQNSYDILDLVPSAVTYWTERSSRRKSYSYKAALRFCWSLRYNSSTVVITIWMTVTKYPYLKWQWIFFSFLYHCLLHVLTAYMSNTVGVLSGAGTGYHSRAPKLTLWLFDGISVVNLFNLCVVQICVFTLWVTSCDVLYDFRIKNYVWWWIHVFLKVNSFCYTND